jgi:hypothetical protein
MSNPYVLASPLKINFTCRNSELFYGSINPFPPAFAAILRTRSLDVMVLLVHCFFVRAILREPLQSAAKIFGYTSKLPVPIHL